MLCLQALSSVLLKKNAHCPRHLRIGLMADRCPERLADRVTSHLIMGVSRFVHGSGFIRLPSGKLYVQVFIGLI
jgi:hypothetical protein